MKTTPWTLPPNFADAAWGIDDTAIFSSDATNVDESGQLLSALLAGAAYAGMGKPFQIFSQSRDELVRFTPGQPVEGVPQLTWALREIALHLDRQVREAVVVRFESVRLAMQDEARRFIFETLAAERAKLEAEFAQRAADAGLAPAEVPGQETPAGSAAEQK